MRPTRRFSSLHRAIRALVLLAVLLGPAFTAAVVLPMPPLALRERGAYRALDAQSGAQLWESDWELTRADDTGRPVLHLHENGAGVRDRPVPTAWTDEMMIDLWGSQPQISATREVRDRQQALTVETRAFDYAQGVGRIDTQNLRTGSTRTLPVHLTTQTIPVELLSALLRLAPAAPDRELRFSVVTSAGQVVDMNAKIVGREPVTVPAGTFPCFKVAMAPTGIVGAVATLLMPAMYLWQTEAPPHFWVKFRGSDGPGSREIVRELLRFTTG